MEGETQGPRRSSVEPPSRPVRGHGVRLLPAGQNVSDT